MYWWIVLILLIESHCCYASAKTVHPPLYVFNNDDALTTNNKNEKVNNGTIFVSSPIVLSSAVPFGNSLHTVVRVLNNGIIILGDGILAVPGSPDLQHAFGLKLNIIAPFWADIDPNEGEVYISVFEKCTTERNVSLDGVPSSVLERAERDVEEFHDLSPHSFHAVSVVIATWIKVRPFGNNLEVQESTFQVVFVSGWQEQIRSGQNIWADDQTSYIIFLYQNDGMNWTYTPGRVINIGFTNGIDLKVLRGTNSPLVAMLDKQRGNTGRVGAFSYKVGSVSSSAAKCQQYICKNAALMNDPVYDSDVLSLYKCPCTLDKLGPQWQLFEKRGDLHDTQCYVISDVGKGGVLGNNPRNKLCCYRVVQPHCNDSWELTYQKLKRSSYLLFSPDSGHILIGDPWTGHEALDNVQAHEMCCVNSSKNMCDKFYKMFPDQGCSDTVTFGYGYGYGDLQITTFDGLNYTMNQWGEYILMKIESEQFILQTRTGRAERINSEPEYATVFKVFAAKQGLNSHFQVELSPSSTSMIIFVNGVDVTQAFYTTPRFMIAEKNVYAFRECIAGNVYITATFSCGKDTFFLSLSVHR